MTIQILATKLYVPQPRSKRVLRSNLIERLNHGRHRKLTLISAPAGFGKTSLLSEWIDQNEFQTAWISLDEGDGEPVHFLSYLISALQKINPDLGSSVYAILQAPQPPPIKTLMTSLINDITTLSGESILVLDDYHLVDVPAIHEILSFLIDHLPPQLHLVITTRADPSLPIARLRGMDQLSEFRASDLSFSIEETDAFFNEVMGLSLTEADINSLDARTEGWVAGLQLAALSMKDREDVSAYINSFQGTDRHIVDYLAEEVLHRQPKHIQEFLIKTSILTRLSEPLCDFVTGKKGSQQILSGLENKGLFIVPLDDHRHWFRYLHLFADLLTHRLEKNSDILDPIETYHIRASQWYEENDFEIEALRHAVIAKDFDRVERLINCSDSPLYLRGEAAVIVKLLDSIPATLRDARPQLWVLYAWASMFSGMNSTIEEKLVFAENAIQAMGDRESYRDLEGQIASMRGLMGITAHDPESIISHSNRALELLDPDNISVRTATNFGLGYAHQLNGDLEDAKQSHKKVLKLGVSNDNTIYSVGAAISLGQISETENELKQGYDHYQNALHLAGDTPQLMAGEAHLGLARIHYEWDEVNIAGDHGQKCFEFVQQIDTGDTFCNHALLLSRIKLAEGDTKSALSNLQKADKYADQHGYLHMIPALTGARILVLLHLGKLDEAEHLAQKPELSMSLVRVLLAQGEPQKAFELLAPLHDRLADNSSNRELLRLLVLLTLVHHGSGNEKLTSETLHQALVLAEKSGNIRVFLDEGQPLKKILEEQVEKDSDISQTYMRKLLTAFNLKKVLVKENSLPEQLSQRELEVLEYIAAGLSNQKISEVLFISMNTIKTHIRNIYSKLDANSRTKAVAKAQELGLL